MLKVMEVEPLPGYKLRLRYADGVAGEVDLSHLVQLKSPPVSSRVVSRGGH